MSPFWELERYGARSVVRAADGAKLTYAQLAELADRTASDLPARTVFALECGNNLATVAAYLGALRKGAVALLLDGELNPQLRDGIYQRFRIGPVFDSTRGIWTHRPRGEQTAAVNPQLGLLMSTSGSTGSPKLVRLSRDNLGANAASIVQYLELNRDDVAISALPLHYSYGLSVLNTHLAVGASMVLTAESVTTAGFWEAMREGEVTNLAGVPTTWRTLRRLRYETMQLPSLRTLTQAGGHLAPEEVEWLACGAQACGRRAFIMYGQTEATARIAYLPPSLTRQKAGSIGVAIPGGHLRLLGPNRQEITEQKVEGQLAYRGPNVMLGYAEAVEDFGLGPCIEELDTGDLGWRDEDGCYWITGRLKRFIKLFGHRFGLDEVEEHLRASGYVAGVVGHDDRLMVGLVGTGEQAQDLRTGLARRYRIHPSAIAVTCLADLPRNAAGKLLYGELTQRIASARGTETAHA